MKPKRLMMIAGEPSGDLLAAELIPSLVQELTERGASFRPRVFGAGGPSMAAAGAEVLVDMTPHSAIGISDVFKKILTYRRIFKHLLQVAAERQPDAIVCVDFSGFNRRFAQAVKSQAGKGGGWFLNWNPKIVQYVSPQVWASRPGRAEKMQHAYDLVLTLFPFEKDWYARRTPNMRVEFVGHPMLDRYASILPDLEQEISGSRKSVLLLPGSRSAELRRHLPVLLGAVELIRKSCPEAAFRMVVPSETLAATARQMGTPSEVELQVGGLPEALLQTDLALASTGTVTMECAIFGVPTVALYKTSWSTYQIGRRIVTVRYLAMPNILAQQVLYPEFVQDDATAENVARAALDLLQDRGRRFEIRRKLAELRESLGGRGGTKRAAKAIAGLLTESDANARIRE